MATSFCPKCENTSFEAVEASVKNSNIYHHFIQCSACGAVVGVTDSHYIAGLLKRLAEKINVRLDLC